MQTNAVPHFDDSVNETGCCPRFNPDGWDGQELHFRNKHFLRAETRSAIHIPLNMGSVFGRVNQQVEDTGGWDKDNMIVLSRDLSSFKGEHLFSLDRDVPGEETATLTGDFVTRVFEGPYRNAKDWYAEMEQIVKDRGSAPGRVYFFYTTCPKCAKHYVKNYVVGVAEV